MHECPYCRRSSPHALRCPNCQYDLTQPPTGAGVPTDDGRGARARPGRPSPLGSGPGRGHRPPVHRRPGKSPGFVHARWSIPRSSEEALGGGLGGADAGRRARRRRDGGTPAVPSGPCGDPGCSALRLDDGRKDGEWIRIRRTSFSIGRDEGDLTFPQDQGISRLHAVLECRFDGGHHWYLKDLNTTNGTFVRCLRRPLGPTRYSRRQHPFPLPLAVPR